MKIHLYLRYKTAFGEQCLVRINDGELQPLQYLNDEFWHGIFHIDTPEARYQYYFQSNSGEQMADWETDRRLALSEIKADELQVLDYWNPAGAVENAFFTQPFRQIFFRDYFPEKALKKQKTWTHEFRVKAPVLGPGEQICLLGHGKGLRNWDTAAPILLERDGEWWQVRLDLAQEDFPLGYKYGVWNASRRQFLGFEEGANRTLYEEPWIGERFHRAVQLHDGFARLPHGRWKGAGVAVPVFSLRSEHGWGVGEFNDLKLLADWTVQVGMQLIQLLPINDTTATHTWTDSYPYAAVSAYALHPIYLNVDDLAGKKHAALIKPFQKRRKALNALPEVDYEAVISLKWEAVKILYPLLKTEWLADPEWKNWYAENRHWLDPYAVFCAMRDRFGTSDFNQWSEHKTCDAAAVAKLTDPQNKRFDEFGPHLFLQWRLHLQLTSAVAYAHEKGVALKGDIPIGIYRYSCDAWVAPEYYNMEEQAGAPPDDFAVQGQNWGFPTYNWTRMKADHYAWWRSRFRQMSYYFDAFRVDHILGFFRIWSIPMHAVEGIMGRFVPAIPLTEKDFLEAGTGFDWNRLCRPLITDSILWELFGDRAPEIKKNFLQAADNGQYVFLPKFDTQRKIEAHFEKSKNSDTGVRDLLYSLHANIILIEDKPNGYHFRINMDKTSSFAQLPSHIKERLYRLYLNYFYQKQDEFWKKEAMEKLPALKQASNMLICGEDLGMVPHCVPEVMSALGILSLEIQRMPKAVNTLFFHPKNAPYLSVVTPDTHDMSTLRGWWEENRDLTQRYYNEILLQQGDAPWFCEPWINRMILEQHFHSTAMWSIFQLQDILGIDGELRRDDPHAERINVPANPKHYWRYRMHLDLEALQSARYVNEEIGRMILESGRK